MLKPSSKRYVEKPSGYESANQAQDVGESSQLEEHKRANTAHANEKHSLAHQ